MKIFYDLKENKHKVCIALGFFDGLHLGHVRVIKEMIKCSKENDLIPSLLTFQSSPKCILKKYSDPKEKCILQEDEKIRILEELGVQNLYIIDFKSILNLNADDFIEKVLIEKLNVKHIFCGFNYHFGKGGKNTAEILSEKCKKYDVKVHIIPAKKYENKIISSSLIKDFLERGYIEKVNGLLGREYSYTLPVVCGEKMGAQLLFPTINQNFPKNFIIPKFGVYKSKTDVDGKIFNSITNIGIAPTLKNEAFPLSETFILNFQGEKLYNKIVKVSLLKYLRPEKKFNSIDELRQAIKLDLQGISNTYKKNIQTRKI